jgi:hypothetical protein
MARILVLQHGFKTGAARRTCRNSALQLLIDEWEGRGHSVACHSGLDDLPEADLAILHVDLSLVPSGYAAAAARYPRAVNARALDIRKRNVSRLIIGPDDAWSGPVIVKTDLNSGGIPEYAAGQPIELADGTTVPPPNPYLNYPILDHRDQVAEWVWTSPHMVVERFLPEQDARGFYLRSWIFFGEREVCRRFRSDQRMLKGENYAEVELAEVPESLRPERERLGFDYGKFDFVVRDGEAILLDANKTPGMPRPENRLGYASLAEGLASFLAAGA